MYKRTYSVDFHRIDSLHRDDKTCNHGWSKIDSFCQKHRKFAKCAYKFKQANNKLSCQLWLQYFFLISSFFSWFPELIQCRHSDSFPSRYRNCIFHYSITAVFKNFSNSQQNPNSSSQTPYLKLQSDFEDSITVSFRAYMYTRHPSPSLPPLLFPYSFCHLPSLCVFPIPLSPAA